VARDPAAANDLTLPAMLPLPHPQMRADQPAQGWLTPEDLDGLARTSGERRR
jgi:hypothetical protein